mgnify:CR=1 FL=1
MSFPNLKYLDISDVNIDSVECLQSVYFPNLKCLILGKNRINSIQSLRKCSLKHLFILSAVQNIDFHSIRDPQFLNELDCKDLRYVFIRRINKQYRHGTLVPQSLL